MGLSSGKGLDPPGRFCARGPPRRKCGGGGVTRSGATSGRRLAEQLPGAADVALLGADVADRETQRGAARASFVGERKTSPVALTASTTSSFRRSCPASSSPGEAGRGSRRRTAAWGP